MPVHMFCFIRVALSHAYSRDVMPVGYGGPGGKYGIVLPVLSRSGPLTLKDRWATLGGEIKCYTTISYEKGSFVTVSPMNHHAPIVQNVTSFVPKNLLCQRR